MDKHSFCIIYHGNNNMFVDIKCRIRNQIRIDWFRCIFLCCLSIHSMATTSLHYMYWIVKTLWNWSSFRWSIENLWRTSVAKSIIQNRFLFLINHYNSLSDTFQTPNESVFDILLRLTIKVNDSVQFICAWCFRNMT